MGYSDREKTFEWNFVSAQDWLILLGVSGKDKKEVQVLAQDGAEQQSSYDSKKSLYFDQISRFLSSSNSIAVTCVIPPEPSDTNIHTSNATIITYSSLNFSIEVRTAKVIGNCYLFYKSDFSHLSKILIITKYSVHLWINDTDSKRMSKAWRYLLICMDWASLHNL